MKFISTKRYHYYAEESLEKAALLDIHCIYSQNEIFKLAKMHSLKLNFVNLEEFNESRIYFKRLANDDEYEVDEILDFITIKGYCFYFIKWKNFDDKYNTWEPLKNLSHCKPLRKKFHENHNYRGMIERLYRYFYDHNLNSSNIQIHQKYLRQKFNIPPSFPTNINKLYHFVMHKMTLKKWEDHINNIIGFKQISVENNNDYLCPPSDFIFINDYIPGFNVSILNEPLLGCNCLNNCTPMIKEASDNNESIESPNNNYILKRNKLCCSFMSGFNYPYNKIGRLMLKAGIPIYECNKLCQCDPNLCQSRIVQKGNSNLKFAIYKTKDKGWGVKSLQKIYKNTFVMEYIEAEQRGKEYDSNGITYLLDLDFCDENNAFTIDAGHYGNISHFVNHSCDPNLVVYAVYINNLDIRMPRIALFARRDINKDEELTFDYLNSANNHYSTKFGVKSPNCKPETYKEDNSKKSHEDVNLETPDKLDNEKCFEKHNVIKYKNIGENVNLLTPPPSSLDTNDIPSNENESVSGCSSLEVKPDIIDLINNMCQELEESICTPSCKVLKNESITSLYPIATDNICHTKKHFLDVPKTNDSNKKCKLNGLNTLSLIKSDEILNTNRIICQCESLNCRTYIF